MKVITFLNNKGGVGKSTLCANIAKYISSNGKLVLIDADSQGSLRDWHNIGKSGMDLICGDKRQSLYTANKLSIQNNIKYMFIDTPGKMLDVSGAALSISDMIIIPLQPSGVDVWASMDTFDLVRCVKNMNANLKVLIVLNKCIPKCTLNSETLNALLEHAADFPICEATICGRIAFIKSFVEGETVFETKDMTAQKEMQFVSSAILKILSED